MPAFWNVPKGIWTIDFDEKQDRISVLCNGEAVAWGDFFYLDEMVNTFRQYQWSSIEPNCIECGHPLLDHLLSLRILKYSPSCNCGRVVHYSDKGCTVASSGCNWGGGLEGSCYCHGYKTK